MDQTFVIKNKRTGETRKVTPVQAKEMGFDAEFINKKLKAEMELLEELGKTKFTNRTFHSIGGRWGMASLSP